MLEAPSPPQLLENFLHFQSIDKQIVLPHQEYYQCRLGLQLPYNTYTMIVSERLMIMIAGTYIDTKHDTDTKLMEIIILFRF